MAIQGTLLSALGTVAGGALSVTKDIVKAQEYAEASAKRVQDIVTARQKQMERVRSFKEKYKDFGGKEGYMKALEGHKLEQKGKMQAFKTNVGTFEKGTKMYDKLVAMGQEPNAVVKKGQ